MNKLKTVTSDLNKLNYLADNDVGKKTRYDKLVTKVGSVKASITSELISKTQYDWQTKSWKENWRC